MYMTTVHVLTPACNALMQFSKDRDKPIFVIGSGKTAMDTMNALDSELGASVAGRIRCVTGHGAWFMMRDPPPDRPEEPDPFARWFDYDGSNGAAINKMLGEQGQLHSPCKTGNFSIHFAHTSALKAKRTLQTRSPRRSATRSAPARRWRRCVGS